MDIGKSINIALIQTKKSKKWLSEQMDTSQQQIYNWVSSGGIQRKKLIKLSGIFNMKVSEFIALGED